VIIHRDKAHTYANAICVKLKDLIPRQQFDVPSKALSAERLSAALR
jgi:translation elongation factor EF-4